MDVRFAKYHALGNDFLIIERRRSPGRRRWALARDICNRHSGVGADGVVCVSPSRLADFRIDIYNADGGWAEKSGNGIRIAAVWASRRKLGKKLFIFECGGSTNKVWVAGKSGKDIVVSAELGQPNFAVKSLPMTTRSSCVINGILKFGKFRVRGTCLSIGNPHMVIPMDNFRSDWMAIGAVIEHAPMFPRGTNVEFVRVVNRRKIQVMEWERGVGPTGSSGTGAAAAVAAMVVQGRIGRTAAVQFPAGVLQINWRAADNVIELTGPVTFVSQGVYRY
jgi:diaminopimelate epimerase